ncbi:MAG TPA: hypothetical protein VFO39_02370 [Candidatus Sulfotelmatobacter sp.]|nr:hypothetical protein [Candidatus Sulfotelmatobacter sp.]
MGVPWIDSIKNTGQLSVFNKAAAWADGFHQAVIDFNQLGLGVKLVAAKDEKSAHVVVLLSIGPGQYNYRGDIASTDSNFKPDRLHGQTSALAHDELKDRFFAAIFLPGKIKGTKKQREVIIVHEFIHAAGMVEHDTVGIMFPQMLESQGGLLEYLPEQGAKPMPPIRVGTNTARIVRGLW